MSKNKSKPSRKLSKEFQDADYDVQHAVVRGVNKEELDKLRTIRDRISK